MLKQFTEGHVPLDVATLEGDEAVILLTLMGVDLDYEKAGVAYGHCGPTKMHWIALTGGVPRLYMLNPNSNRKQRKAFTAVADKAGREIDRMNCCGNN